jgi:hypothetical protein
MRVAESRGAEPQKPFCIRRPRQQIGPLGAEHDRRGAVFVGIADLLPQQAVMRASGVIASANNPLIRLLPVPRVKSDAPSVVM